MVVPVDATGEVCVVSLKETDLIVDVSAWFDAGLRSAAGRLVDTRTTGVRLTANVPLRVPVLGLGGVPSSGVTGVALNVTAVKPSGAGWMQGVAVWFASAGDVVGELFVGWCGGAECGGGAGRCDW